MADKVPDVVSFRRDVQPGVSEHDRTQERGAGSATAANEEWRLAILLAVGRQRLFDRLDGRCYRHDPSGPAIRITIRRRVTGKLPARKAKACLTP